MLFGLTPADPTTFVGVSLIFGLLATLAASRFCGGVSRRLEDGSCRTVEQHGGHVYCR
jgi:hypothetical protein